MKSLILFVSFLLLNSTSEAFFFFEPWIGAETGKHRIQYTAAGESIKGFSNEIATLHGTTGGVRLGIQSMSGPWIATSASLTKSGVMKFDDHEFSFERSAIGLDVGYRFGRLSLFVGHNPKDSLIQIQTPSTLKDICTGTSNKVGISYLVILHVSFNIEALERTFTDCVSDDLILKDLKTNIKSFQHLTTSAYLSFPF